MIVIDGDGQDLISAGRDARKQIETPGNRVSQVKQLVRTDQLFDQDSSSAVFDKVP